MGEDSQVIDDVVMAARLAARAAARAACDEACVAAEAAWTAVREAKAVAQAAQLVADQSAHALSFCDDAVEMRRLQMFENRIRAFAEIAQLPGLNQAIKGVVENED